MLKPAPPARALPRIARASVRALARAPRTVHIGVGILLATVVGAGALVANDVTSTTATPPSAPIVPLTRAAFSSVVTTGTSLDQPLTVRFSTPMDPASVAASLRVQPAEAVDLSWDATGRTLTVRPKDVWLPDTMHAVVVDPGALAENGRPLVKPVRAAFLTRTATDGRIEPTRSDGKRVTTDSSFRITFSRPVTIATVAAGLRAEPVMDGTLTPTPWQRDGTSFTFTPRKRLPADTGYVLTVTGARTSDGEVVEQVVATARTVTAPAVRSFRPKKGATGVDRDAKISVRFTQPMDKAATKDAFRVTANGKAVKGKVSFAEDGKVLVFKPKKSMPYRAKVTVSVGAGATSDIGTPIEKKATATFRIERRPPARVPGGGGGGGGSTTIGTGGSGGGGSWAAVERYYLRLMNCTRTGGWVTSSGSCSSPGGRNVAPLRLDAGISSHVSRPYARLLATSGQCSHYANGGPDDRLRRAGYTSYNWGENIGCRGGNPYAAVLATHLFYQSERSYNGGHYRNLMDAGFSRVGIGVWKSGSTVRLVIDFYHP